MTPEERERKIRDLRSAISFYSSERNRRTGGRGAALDGDIEKCKAMLAELLAGEE